MGLRVLMLMLIVTLCHHLVSRKGRESTFGIWVEFMQIWRVVHKAKERETGERVRGMVVAGGRAEHSPGVELTQRTLPRWPDPAPEIWRANTVAG